MDQRLLAWGLRPSVPARLVPGPTPGITVVRGRRHPLPRLWLFTDHERLPDPRTSVAHLPRGRAGVVLRHDHDPTRPTLARDLARICRARRLFLVVAGDVRLAAASKAGTHLRDGRWAGPVRSIGVVTSSAHSVSSLRRAKAAGAQLVFLSPAFATASHIGAPGLGRLRWSGMARRLPAGRTFAIAALGGIDGRTIRRLPVRLVHAAGAIGALSVG